MPLALRLVGVKWEISYMMERGFRKLV